MRNSRRRFAFFLVLILISTILPFSTAATPIGNEITKAEFVALLTDYFQWPHPNDYNDIWKADLMQFNDVKTSDPFGKQIEAAYEEGLISADDQGNFNPMSGVTRQDAAVLFASAFKIEASETPTAFLDNDDIREDARGSVYALVELGYMRGITNKLFGPDDLIKTEDVQRIFDTITSTVVTPVQALPKQNAIAPRRYIKLYCPTPGATIHFTKDGTTPTVDSPIYTVAENGYINEMLSANQLPTRIVTYKAIAVKDGMITSPVQTFSWTLNRPAIGDFQYKLILEGTDTSPAVYQIFNDSESVRAMAWYIEGSERGIMFDALQTNYMTLNLKTFIDENIATQPYSMIVGHTHGDHVAQAPNFIEDLYINDRGWVEVASSLIKTAENQAKVNNIDEGDVFDLGNCTLHVYALPGHNNSNLILQDKANGLIFSSDIYGCTRAGSADNVAVMGVRTDLLLSLAQQTYSNYKKDGGLTTMLFTGHDETPLGDVNLKLFEAALQQVIDNGEAGCSPTLRGNNDAKYSRTTIIGDMWQDGTNWIALKLAGIMGDNTEYLTSEPVNYNGATGFMQYSVLSNIEIEGGELVGRTVSWAAPSKSFSWNGENIVVENSLPNKFDPWYYEYTIRVPEEQEEITVIPTTMSTKVKSIRLNGKQVEYRSSNTFSVEDDSVFTIEITAPDKITTSTYTFTIEKY